MEQSENAQWYCPEPKETFSYAYFVQKTIQNLNKHN